MEITSSEQQLKQLLDEGKINEEQYEQLLSAMNNPSNQEKENQTTTEPEFRAFRKRVLTGCMIIAVLGFPIGLYFNLPHIWIMSILCLIVSGIKLSRIKDSWLAEYLNRKK